MARFEIVCNDVNYVNNHYKGVDFKAVGYTDNPDVVSQFTDTGLHIGEVPLFEVKEVK